MGGRWWDWYASGGEHWYDVERDLVGGSLSYDLATYLNNVDAVELCPSGDGPGSIPGWYADGALKLRGFYYAQADHTLRCVQLAARPAAPLVGYAKANGNLYRFQEDESYGGYEVLSAVCQRGGEDWDAPWNGVFETGLDIVDGPEAGRRMVTVLAPRSKMAPGGAIGRGCREVSRARGTLLLEDWRSLVERSRRDDPVMHFYRNVEDMPGYQGVGIAQDSAPPADAVRLENGVVDLDGTIPAGGRVERVPQLRVTTVPLPGGFSALIPVRHSGAVPAAGWIVLKLHVRSGRMGFGACPKDRSLLSRTKAFARSDGPQTIALRTPDLERTTDVVIFNEGEIACEVDILEASIVVQREGADRKP